MGEKYNFLDGKDFWDLAQEVHTKAMRARTNNPLYFSPLFGGGIHKELDQLAQDYIWTRPAVYIYPDMVFFSDLSGSFPERLTKDPQKQALFQFICTTMIWKKSFAFMTF